MQSAAFPVLSSGRHAVLHSYTGSGKTLAYLLPLLKRVDPDSKAIQLLVLAPSRELATQIAQVASQVRRDGGPYIYRRSELARGLGSRVAVVWAWCLGDCGYEHLCGGGNRGGLGAEAGGAAPAEQAASHRR